MQLCRLWYMLKKVWFRITKSFPAATREEPVKNCKWIEYGC